MAANELPSPLEIPTLVLFDALRSLCIDQVAPDRRAVAEKLRVRLERNVLPDFLVMQRWFAAKDKSVERVTISQAIEWGEDDGDWLLMLVDVRLARTEVHRYFMPLALIWGEDESVARTLRPFTLAKVRQEARVGLLCDAFADEAFCNAVVKCVGRGLRISCGDVYLVFGATSTHRCALNALSERLSARRPTAEGSNTAVILGDRLLLKAYRRVQPGINPELEIGRFLTEESPFANVVSVVGALECQGANCSVSTLCLLQEYFPNNGDAWSYTLAYLKRFLEDCSLKPAEYIARQEENPHSVYLMAMGKLGTRTGELHLALSKTTGDPGFDPEPVTGADLRVWTARVRREAETTFARLDSMARLPELVQEETAQILALKGVVFRWIAANVSLRPQMVKIRHHGDYHLGQVLVVENDFIIIDFEGEPLRPLLERRAKHCGLRDVAGMMRSFDYAAWVALREATAELGEESDQLQRLACDWARQACRAFVDGYKAAVRSSPVYPEDESHARSLLQLLSLEKSLYEIRYELDNRPNWVEVPLRSIVAMCESFR